MTKSLIHLRDLTIKDPYQRILVDKVSIDLFENEFVGIVGESGSGKTITVQAIIDILSKELHVNYKENNVLGNPMHTFTPKEKRKLIGSGIGFVPQNTIAFLHPFIKIKNQIGDAFILHTKSSKAEALDKAIVLLHKVGIKDSKRILDSYPVQLSGGMKQRVNIAMALMTDPKVIVADEPTTALDTIIQSQVMKLFQNLNKNDGVSILFISHDLRIIKRFCNRMYVMYHGKVVESGDTEEIFCNPAHRYTKELLGLIPKLTEGKIERLG